VDNSEDFLREARSRGLPNTEFRTNDLGTLPDLGIHADGLWSSFTAAYFPDLSAPLTAWIRNLKPGAWIALTEIDDLFGHELVSPRTRQLFEAYAKDALEAGRYDFHMGRKLKDHLRRLGCSDLTVLTVDDQEFSFRGPARPEVVDAWRDRFKRMSLLRTFFGSKMDEVEGEFLDCLAREDHQSAAKVYCCIGRVHLR
jgi:hypothetical protein